MPIRDWKDVLGFVTTRVETAKERRAAITSFVPDMINEGLNQTQALSLFRLHNLGIRSSDFADIYQSFSQRNELFADISELTPDDQIAENLMSRSSNLIDTRYRWVANVGYEDNEIGRFSLGSFSYGSDENLTIIEIEDRFRDILSSYYGKDPRNIHSIQITRAYFNPDSPF